MDHAAVIEALRAAGAGFALVHGSRAGGQRPRPDGDLDVGAWWGTGAPDPWEVRLPGYVDLVVLDTAPLWLAGRVAQCGHLLFDDDPGCAGRLAGRHPAALRGRVAGRASPVPAAS